MSDFTFLRAEVSQEGIASVRLARPPANAVNDAMYIELAALFRDPDQLARGVRAIVLSGEGRHFCAGNDLAEFATMTPANGSERMWRVREAFFAIQECPVPVIGSVHGAAVGTGLAIAASCDFIVAAADATFALPELTVGVMGGARHLARMASQPLVRRMFLTGEPLTAAAFEAAGGSIIVCELANLQTESFRHAKRISSLSPTAVRLGKQILNRIENMELQHGYTFEQQFTVRMSGHPDSKEALSSKREGRTAEYREPDPRWRIEVEN